LLEQEHEALLGPGQRPKLTALDLAVDYAHKGELRNPIKFGIKPSICVAA